ncbi:MAG TPA: DUF2085 domain-containing protein [Candidatus Thermoplasmatota archaeon]
MRANTLLLVGWIFNFVWVASLFVAPYTLDPGTVRGLDGRANVVDYGERWSDLPWFAGAVYAFGDLNCHQMEHRSWILNGNQMPVDARMTAGFVGAALALPFLLLLVELPRMRDQVAQLVPAKLRPRLSTPKRRLWFFIALCAVTLGPAIVDLALQFGGVESTNARRTVTGLLMGAGLALVAGSCIKMLLAPLPVVRPTRVVAT